jgi:C4-dicarboxylate-specific signal transduction histidine kinase
MIKTRGRILIIDDDPGIRTTLSDILEGEGYEVKDFGTAGKALDFLKKNPFDVIFVDLKLPDMDGMKLLEQIKLINPESAVIMITGHASIATAVEALNDGAYAYIVKPFDLDELKTIVKKAIKAIRLSLENKELIDQLQITNRELEKYKKSLEERTAELTAANEELTKEVAERKRAEAELKATQEKMIETARKAGMAEVAAYVLHNVGNVLNSINVSTTLISEKIANSELANLGKLAKFINSHIEDLGTFLTEHPQGKYIPVYLTEVSKCLTDEQADFASRFRVLADNVEHIKDLISTQQSYAKVSSVQVQASIAKLIEDAVRINGAGLQRHGARLIREFDELPEVEIDRQRVLQILVNLISNAKYALSGGDKEEKLLTIRLYGHGKDRVRIEVADNGVGIPRENLTNIFDHGFTTRQDGHGFGLHSSALAAQEMGGSLTVYSDGAGKGATFTLELPFTPVNVRR